MAANQVRQYRRERQYGPGHGAVQNVADYEDLRRN